MNKKEKDASSEIQHKIKEVDMPERMQEHAVSITKKAINKALTENKIARTLQEIFADEYSG